MEQLINLGISLETIKSMLEINPDLTNEEVMEKKEILLSIGCNNQELINIIGSNAMFISRTKEEIITLIEYLKKLGFTYLNLLFDSNPYILNLEPFEINSYIKTRLSKRQSLEDIVDDLDSNPYLFNEI